VRLFCSHSTFKTKRCSAYVALTKVVLFCAAILRVDQALAAESDHEFIARNLKTVTWGQYMHVACKPIEVSGWRGIPTERCDYSSDSFGVKLPVVLVIPDDGRLNDWFSTACADIPLSNIRTCTEKLAIQAKCQANNQFVVAGLVDEGRLFFFRDGVTVSVEGVATGGGIGLNRAPTESERKLSLTGRVTTVQHFARIVGTSREDYAEFTGRAAAEVAEGAWQDTIRAEFQAAWTSSTNRLVSSWAHGNRSALSDAVSITQFKNARCDKGTKWQKWSTGNFGTKRVWA
jgi:hypothetical protein